MKYIVSILLTFTLIVALSHDIWATHNRAGEITFVHEPLAGQPYRYLFTITTYTKVEGGGSAGADRDTLEVDFGDGSDLGKAPRINGNGGGGVDIGNNIRHNIYEISHSYPAPFNYVVSMKDPNRIDGIVNIQFGQSVDIPFFLQDTIFFRDPQFFGLNSSPILLQPPIDYGNVGYPFIHNPNAFDVDGDSLYFELISPKADINNDVPIYQYPDEVSPGPDNNISLNSNTGEFIWDAPQQAGIYNIAFLIREFRNGVQIGNMIRDMQVLVEDVDNQPPAIEPLNEICIIAGETLEIELSATDPNSPEQTITVSAYGGPLEIDNPASLQAIPGFSSQENSYSVKGKEIVKANFIWPTICDHIFSDAYTVVIKAEDDFFYLNEPLPLADLETWQITVAAPAPTGLTATIQDKDIELAWDAPYICQDSYKFRGFSIWRSVGCDSLILDECQLGLGGTSYQKIAEGIQGNTYTDDKAVPGVLYAYRVIAEFADAFTNGAPPTPLNVVSSIASENVCIELPQDIPIITHVDIEVTATDNGQVWVRWSKPLAIDLDTMVNNAPYRYELYRAEGFEGNDFELVTTYEYTTFGETHDTTYLDVAPLLNTKETPYRYKVAFLSAGELVGETEIASSVFLEIDPGDNQLTLSWNFNVPWFNEEYLIYQETSPGVFNEIISTTNTSHVIEELVNGVEYCYYVEASGTYGSEGLPDPLINRSQIMCESPIDTVPPCPPVLSVSNDCDLDLVEWTDELQNLLEWTNPTGEDCDDDIVGYEVYYSSPFNPDYEVLEELNSPFRTSFEHLLESSLAGCYAVAAIDSFDNISPYSNIVCVENCLDFELPNVFTPNGDGDNDLFIPRNSRFVSSIEMNIYNRWGGIVYETTDPLINWDGTDQASGTDLNEGVYFYVCAVKERTSDGVELVSEELSGYIHLIRK